MFATSVASVAIVPILPTPPIASITTLMFACQLVVALGVLVLQILMHFSMLPTVQTLFVSLVMLIFEIVVVVLVPFGYALMPIRMSVVIVIAIISVS